MKSSTKREREREKCEYKEKLKSFMTANFKHFRLFKICKLKEDSMCQG